MVARAHAGNQLKIAVVLALALPLVAATSVTVHADRPGKQPACAGPNYTVTANDGWSTIALAYQVKMGALLKANDATITTPIYPGSVVCLPAEAIPPAPTTTLPPAPVTIDQFPVQGPCGFADTFGAPRANGRLHEGVDFIAKTGQYVYAAGKGRLTRRYRDKPGALSGNGWQLTKADGTYYFYGHLSAFAPGLEVGMRVQAGQVIGFVGNTGNSATSHLHFEVHPNGGPAVNPTPIVRAVDGCKITDPPAQPGGVAPPPVPPPPAPTTTVLTTSPDPSPILNPTPDAGGSWSMVKAVTALSTNGSRLKRNVTTTVSVASLAGVSPKTAGVLVRVTARNFAGSGVLSMHACAVEALKTSTINLGADHVNAGVAMVAVSGGAICVTSSVATDVRIDVIGFMAADGTGLRGVSATRALDTRDSTPLASGNSRSMSRQALGVPAKTKAVVLTVTLIGAESSGTITIGGCGGRTWSVPFPKASLQSFSAIAAPTDAGVCIASSAAVQAIVDVTGAFVGGKSVTPSGPTRIYDSRGNGGVGSGVTQVAVPGGGSTALVSLAIIGGESGSSVFLFACGQARPDAAAGATSARTVTAVTAAVALNGGALCLSATTPTNVIVDLLATG